MLDFEHISQIDLQAMAGVDEGNISRRIRNIHERINRTFSIIQHSPLKVAGKEATIIEQNKLDEFNDLVEDFDILEDLRKKIFDPDQASPDLDATYYGVFVPKYEKRVDELLKREAPDKKWKDIQFSDIYLRKYLLREIMKLGYQLQGQVSLALVQTLPRDEIERLTRNLAQSRRGMQWEG